MLSCNALSASSLIAFTLHFQELAETAVSRWKMESGDWSFMGGKAEEEQKGLCKNGTAYSQL